VIQPLDGSDTTGKVLQVMSEITDADYNLIVGKLSAKHQNKYIIKCIRGDFDGLKKAAFYVDIDGNDRVTNSPGQISRDTTDRVLRLVARAITTIKWELRRRQKVAQYMKRV
jgi:hypothetical protein